MSTSVYDDLLDEIGAVIEPIIRNNLVNRLFNSRQLEPFLKHILFYCILLSIVIPLLSLYQQRIIILHLILNLLNELRLLRLLLHQH